MAYNFTQCHDAARGYAAHLRSTLPYHAPRAHRSIIEKSLKSAVPSSTPHAPRNLVNQHGQPVPKKRQYKILENHALKSASAPNLLTNKDDKQNDIVGKFSTNQKQQASTTKPSKVTQAWTTEDVVSKKVVKVKPYRRSTGRKAPTGVPLLDLRKLNGPDSEMEPIELLPVSPDSSHTNISWGAFSKMCGSDNKPDDTMVEVEDTEVIQDGGVAGKQSDKLEEESSSPKQAAMENIHHRGTNMEKVSPSHDSTSKDRTLETPAIPFDSMVMEKIEQQMEDDQLGQQMVTTPTPTKPKPYGESQKTKIINQHLKPTSLHYYAGISKDNTGSLNKRIKFTVRLITRNGRDIHREMCGFFFTSDNSITIYELRQFGKRLTAIPLVQRGVYKHLRGTCKGLEYEVNNIRKGTVLQFDTATQQSLPVSLLQHRMVSFKVTAVDEESKKQLLLDGIKDLAERRRMEQYLSQSLPDQGRDNTVLCTVQAMMRERLNGRAAKTLIGLGRQLAKSSDKDGVTFLQLQLALRQFHISITPEDLQRFWSLVDPDGMGSVDHVTCMQGLMGEMKEARKQLVHQLFRKLDVAKAGHIPISNFKTYFNPRLHPEVVAGRKTCDEMCFIVFNSLELSQPGTKCHQQTISFAEFEDYFEGVSIDTPNDEDFTKIIKGCWGLS